MVSWFDALQSWKRGVAYPHWAASANFGAGEPRFVFYPPLTWMLGAALGAVLPWTWVPVAMVFVLLCGTGLGVRAFARRLLPEGAATLAGVAAVLCVYPLFTAYDRAAFGELAGGFWIPLLLLFAMKDREGGSLGWSTVGLALVVAGCWLSDAPVGVMAMYLLAAVAGAAAVMARSWLPVVRAAMAGALGLGLAAVYIVPAAWEQRWVNVRKASGLGDPGLLIENNWLFGHSSDPALRWHDAGLHFVSWLAVAMLTVTVVGMVVVWRRGGFKGGTRRVWVVLGLIPAAVLVLQLPVSLVVWNVLPKLRFLQFPWRWLLVLETPMAVFLTAAVWPARRWRRVVGMVVFLGVTLGSLMYTNATALNRACDYDELPTHLMAALGAGAGSWGADEYEPIGTDISLVPSGLPEACFVKTAEAELATSSSPNVNPAWKASEGTCLSTASAVGRGTDHLRLKALGAGGGYVVLRLHSYPAWRVRVNGVVVNDLGWREDGLMAVPVPAGAVEVSVDWVTTWDVVAGRVVSLLAVGVMSLLWWLGRKAGPSLRSG
jgi:hypothetical protein